MMNAIHAALRREAVATASLKHWSRQYRGNPTDANAALFHLAWVELRAAVDALVAIPLMGLRDEMALATAECAPHAFVGDHTESRCDVCGQSIDAEPHRARLRPEGTE